MAVDSPSILEIILIEGAVSPSTPEKLLSRNILRRQPGILGYSLKSTVVKTGSLIGNCVKVNAIKSKYKHRLYGTKTEEIFLRFNNYKYTYTGQAALGSQRQASVCEFQASLIY